MDGTFTLRVLAEVAPHLPPLQCCRRALIEGMLLASPDAPTAHITTTRAVTARAALAALHAQGVDVHASRVPRARQAAYVIAIDDPAHGSARRCCTRSLLRGAILCSGSISRPQAGPHVEILLRSAEAGEQLSRRMRDADLNPLTYIRRGRCLVAVRSSGDVATLLSLIGAHRGRLEFEEGRVIGEVRGGVNRRLNAETANLRRTVIAGVRQVRAIGALAADPVRWEGLPPALREAAELRLRHPEEALGALATRAGCSRSAMAGRLRRIDGLAADIDDGFQDDGGNVDVRSTRSRSAAHRP